jgi:hypothetical protein
MDGNVSRLRISIALLAILLISVFSMPPARARAQGGGWSQPYQLSSEAGAASEGYLVADQYGYVHCFWSEALFESQLNVIKYARFDGTTWTKPNDIHVTGQEIRNISPFVDPQGMLYIAWAQGQSGATHYTYFHTYAPANHALSVQNWALPLKTVLPARTVYMRVDSKGVFHILYIDQTEETGVYYMRSDDKGMIWSEPVWLDPDILPDHIPDSLNFELDENDGLHAAWWYGGLNRAQPDWVRYTHSLDGGLTWSTPLILDRYSEETEHNLTVASPKMIVQGQTVHVIWAAGSLPYRYHRFSTDAGETWSAPVQIFGELHGQAFDGLTVDRAGRVHFLGQIRYPLGIYHAYWEQNRWSKPLLVYFVAADGSDADFGGRVHAHATFPVIRAGNQLILTFTDGPADPNRRLFVMYRTLDDISPLENMPTPVSTATPVLASGPTPGQPPPSPEGTESAPLANTAEIEPVGGVPAPDLAIRVALVPIVLVLGAALILQWLNRRKD